MDSDYEGLNPEAFEMYREQGFEVTNADNPETGEWKGEVTKDLKPVLALEVDPSGNLKTRLQTQVTAEEFERQAGSFFATLSDVNPAFPQSPVHDRRGRTIINSHDSNISFTYAPNHQNTAGATVEIGLSHNRLIDDSRERQNTLEAKLARLAVLVNDINKDIPTFLVRSVCSLARNALMDF